MIKLFLAHTSQRLRLYGRRLPLKSDETILRYAKRVEGGRWKAPQCLWSGEPAAGSGLTPVVLNPRQHGEVALLGAPAADRLRHPGIRQE